jgi:hypothetical protein
MKASLVCLLVCIFVACGCRTVSPVPDTPVSVQGQAPFVWDFGKVKEGTVQEHAFVFKNESQRTVQINQVQTSCGCTVSHAQKNTLSPGDSTQIPVRFDSHGYSGPTEQFVYVHTDNLDNPIVRFIIKAYVVK